MTQLIDGKAIAAKVRAEVASGVESFQNKAGRAPGLDVILVGDDPASAVYVRNKERSAIKVGLKGRVHRLAVDTTAAELMALVQKLNEDPAVDGILVQLPVPAHIPVEPILAAIDPAKDVDGFHAVNVGALWSGRPTLTPCTPLGCMRLLQEANVKVEGARALVIGRSNLVGKPLAGLLLQANATVTIAHSRTLDLASACRQAEILIVAAGRPKMVPGDWIAPGATVIDVGIHRQEDGSLCGDVDFESAQHVASAITPVPGGVGPMTIAMLFENTLMAANARLGQK